MEESRLIHISDLHYKSGWPEENDIVLEAFLSDLERLQADSQPSYLVVSGDLAHAGDSSQYQALQDKWDSRLARIGIDRERRIVVPGNHDIQQAVVKAHFVMHNATLRSIDKESDFNEHAPVLAATFLKSGLENYIRAEAAFAGMTACQETIWGQGWSLNDDVGVYCLNTAACSSGGLQARPGKPTDDEGALHVNTRELHRWVAASKHKCKVLVMHHPSSWLSPWAQREIDSTVTTHFDLVLCGHVHDPASFAAVRFGRSTVHAVAPALFTKKQDFPLGYSIIKIAPARCMIEVEYRQWSTSRRFVPGTAIAGNETGILSFGTGSTSAAVIDSSDRVETSPSPVRLVSTLSILKSEFEDSTICYSSKRPVWVQRDLAEIPETAIRRGKPATFTADDFVDNIRTCIIRAPRQFGLTVLGRYIAMKWTERNESRTAVMIDAVAAPHHAVGVQEFVEQRCKDINAEIGSIGVIIVDNWQSHKQDARLVKIIQAAHPEAVVLLLHSIDDCSEIAEAISSEGELSLEVVYLWALDRNRIRELATLFLADNPRADEDAATKKVVDDLAALNIHRTPINCLLLLKLLDQAFDDSPVNRTEMIGRVLYLLFFQFEQIPQYATRPDLKDCEYALGYLAEWLIRNGRSSFTKIEFSRKLHEYCDNQVVDLDTDILFNFLVSEKIILAKGYMFEFRFRYWLYYFAAHRMHHSAEFAQFILSGRRYAATPEIIEFYTGIDRRRADAVQQLTADLAEMSTQFVKRTGVPDTFNPFQIAEWNPGAAVLEKLRNEVDSSVAESTLPKAVKDAAADKNYDRAMPYNQEIAKFIQDSTLIQMVHAMRGAARALRNSDYVLPAAKAELLNQIMTCWSKVTQSLVLVSRLLSEQGSAVFEGMGFVLSEDFDSIPPEQRWARIMDVIPENIVQWFHSDLFSRKLGALLGSHAESHSGELQDFFCILMLIQQRPPNWEKAVEEFIARSRKNAYYLSRVYVALRTEYRVGFASERNHQLLRHFALAAIAKHSTGSRRPSKQLIKKFDRALPEKHRSRESDETEPRS